MDEDKAPARPNVLLVVTRQQRWDTVGAYGSPMDLTPNITRLAREGCTVEQAVSASPTDAPGHASLQTGKHATEVGVWRNSIRLPDEAESLADRFKNAGYDVGFVGCWNLGGSYDEPVPADARGGYHDYWVAADYPEFTTEATEGRLFDREGDPVSFQQYRADAFTDYGLEAIDSLAEPFLLVVSYLEPHHQNEAMSFIAPGGYAERYRNSPHVPGDLAGRPGDWYAELPDYYGAVKRVDECIGRLRDRLEATTGLQESIIAYTSLYGCHFNTRPGEYARTPHESSIRVPMILSGGPFDTANDVTRVTSLLDLHPTLLEAAGLNVPENLHGESVFPVVRGETRDDGNDVFVQISESQIGRAIRTDRFTYAVAAPKLEGWRAGSGEEASDVYVERYLYDHRRDPHQGVNLVGHPAYRERSEELRDRIAEYIRDVEDRNPDIRAGERGW